MRDRKKGFANLNRNQSNDNSAKSDNNLNNAAQPGPGNVQSTNAGPRVTDEAIDVLSLMGFKL